MGEEKKKRLTVTALSVSEIVKKALRRRPKKEREREREGRELARFRLGSQREVYASHVTDRSLSTS